MAKYDKQTKFYWLQLKEDFFEDDAIEWLEEQQPNGRDYAYFYLKLCLKSLKTNGILMRNVGNILIPYDNMKLAQLTKMDFDTVCVAMELLKKIGLVSVLENGEIYLSKLENLIGSVSKGALKKQQQRTLKMVEKQSQISTGGQKGGQVSTKDRDKDKDKNKVKTKTKNKNKDKDKSYNQPITLTELTEIGKKLGVSKEYCEKFYNTYENTNWANKKGEKITDAKNLFEIWVRQDNKQNNKNIPNWLDENIQPNLVSPEEEQKFKEQLESIRNGE